MTYWTTLGVQHGIRYYRDHQERKQEVGAPLMFGVFAIRRLAGAARQRPARMVERSIPHAS